MFKTVKHTARIITVVVLTIAVTACKSKKAVGSSSPINRTAQEKLNPNDPRFGAMFITACQERKKGNLHEAMKLLEECKNINPQDPAVRYEMAMIYKLLGVRDLALSNAKFCAEADKNNEWYQLLLIDCYKDTKQFLQAIKVREALVKKFPEKSEFKEDLAIEYAMTDQYDKSFKIYEEIERTYGINEQLTLNKVKLLKSQGKWREVEAELQRLSDTDKNEARYYGYLAELYLEQNDLAKAKNMYDKIQAVDPQNPTLELALHDYYSALRDDREAYEHLKKAFNNPNLEPAAKASIIGTFYTKAEANDSVSYRKGMELTTIMLQAHPGDTESNALYADFLRLKGKNKEAAVYYYKAASLERKDFRVWDNLLYIDYETGQFDSLEHHSSMAMEFFPNQPEYYKYNGIANAQLYKYKEAARALKDGMEFVVDNNRQRMDFLSLLGDAYYNLKEYQKSDEAFEQALKIDADNTYVLNNYAYYLSLRREGLDRAEKLSKRANDLRPNDRSYMDTYGWILYQQNKFTEAELWLSKAAALGPKNGTILEHYGDALFKNGKKQEALKQWEAAKQAGNNSNELETKIKTKKLDD
ncbi:MAG: tetratricopeptide repeat protein [Bacteroidia bacterium]|nr:tetratricopeptide repeat protein [Bacteroidia bacterium]